MDHFFIINCKLTKKFENGNENCIGIEKPETQYFFIEGRNDRKKSRKEYEYVLWSRKNIFVGGIKRCKAEQYWENSKQVTCINVSKINRLVT